MYLTGFADEAGASIDEQIRVTRELGWRNIESRGVKVGDFPTGNIHDIPDRAFDMVVEKLNAAGIHINCFGSTIANWGKKIDEPFDSSLAEIRRAIPRMKRLGTKLVRVMSFAVREGEDQMEEERFRRLREIQKMFAGEGLTPVHENCMNYGGMGWQFTLKLLENVPDLKLVYDTGNPIFTVDRSKPEPRPMQSSWEFYSHVKDHVEYIHIKDGRLDPVTKKTIYSYPGEGEADVRRIIGDLLKRGYDGGISIEPHMSVVFHDPNSKPGAEMADIYMEYGRRMMKLIEEVRPVGRKQR